VRLTVSWKNGLGLSRTVFLIIKRLLLICVLANILHPHVASPYEYAFYTYSEDALPDIGTINDIFQDTRGLLWLAGTRGASYYDGREFHRLSVSNGLGDNYCYKITEAPSGKIWICTYSGMSIYDPISGRLEKNSVRPNEPLRDVVFLQDGCILATDNIPYLVQGKGQYDITLVDTLDARSYNPVIHDLLLDRAKNTLWVATEFNGVFSVDIQPFLKNWEMKDPEKQEEYNRMGKDEFDLKYPKFRSELANYVIDDSLERHNTFTRCVKRYDYREQYGNWYVSSLSIDTEGNVWALANTVYSSLLTIASKSSSS